MREVRIGIRTPLSKDEVIKGLYRFAGVRGDWHMSIGDCSTSHVVNSQIEGIIGGWMQPAVRRAYADLGRPMVNVLDKGIPADVPSVLVDDVAVGRLAAEFFAERGYVRVGCFDDVHRRPETSLFWDDRNAAFQQRAEELGMEVLILPLEQKGTREHMLRGLRTLAAPTGLFLATDQMASMVLWTCLELGRRIPDELAILGVDNDMYLCESSRPQLSSIEISWEQIGYAAGELLHDLLEGATPPASPICIPPVGVVERTSTAMTGAGNPAVARALAYIQSNTVATLSVDDVAAHVDVPKRTLQKYFKAEMHISVFDAIRTARFRRSQKLIMTTSLPLAAIAERSGFPDIRAMMRAYKKETGMTPGAYRDHCRPDRLPPDPA
jgi:LacI family transcriptional regulator